MTNSHIVLNNKKVYIESFYYDETYAGVLLGKRGRDLNEEVFGRVSHPVSQWGKRKCIKIIPSDEDFNNRLKPFQFSVWLVLDTNNPTLGDGRELIVTWLGYSPLKKRLEDVIQDGIKNINWEKEAEYFGY